jgi:antitoxin (DNA-binding transcriptional repressor) of toxin-antitoxin stability system
MRIGVLEAKNRFSELVAAAERGEDVVITRRGEPVVRLERLRKGLSADEGEALMRRVIERRRALNVATTWEQLRADRDMGRP